MLDETNLIQRLGAEALGTAFLVFIGVGSVPATLIENGELERAAGIELTPEHSRVMICGNPQMIDDTRQLLKQRDMQLSLTRRPGQVAVENYW